MRRIKVSDAFGHEGQARTSEFDSTLTENFTLATAPIEISTVEDLQRIGNEPSYPLDRDYVLVDDIDASEASGFEPIGSDVARFSGTFRGDGFTIKELTISQPSGENVGLFSVVAEEGTIQNITLENVSIEGDTNTGALVGKNRGEVVESTVSGMIEGDFRTGGLVGWNRNAQIRSSRAAVSVSGSSETGGLVGSNFSTGAEIVSSSSTGTVFGSQDVGGISGISFIGVIENSYSDSDVEASGDNVGGLVGFMFRGGEVISSFSSGDISGNENVGGLIGNGDADDREGIVENVYSTSDVSGSTNVGGLMGVNTGPMSVSNVYSAGNVSGTDNVGGIIGTNGATLEVGFWDTQVTGQDNGIGQGNFDGATGLNTDEMQGESAEQNMDGFDFQDTWQTVMGDYPALFWENN